MKVNRSELLPIIKRALREDIGTGDLTTETLIKQQDQSKAIIKTKETGVIAGLEVVELVFKTVDSNVNLEFLVNEGDQVASNTILAKVKGSTAALLTGERVALNFLQRMSGITTKTKKFCDSVAGLNVRITDTRKTTPSLRSLEKYAVKVGGGYNHRQGLYDAVMIKDNHLQAVGSIKKAVQQARNNISHTTKIEVETENLEQVKEAIKAKADIIMLDNMGLELLRTAVELIEGRAIVEASGGITIDTVVDVAKTGVDVISVGALTHSIDSLDISLDFQGSDNNG